MPDLNLDLDYFEHPKVKRLIALLGPGADVLPIRLWAYCGKFHLNGVLAGYEDLEIERVVGWWGKPNDMVNAMLKLGFLESKRSKRRAHDFSQHQGHIGALRNRNRKVALARWAKIKGESDIKADTNGIPVVLKSYDSGIPQPTILPSVPTISKTKDPVARKSAREVKPPPVFLDEKTQEAWMDWQAYRKEIRKPMSARTIQKQYEFLESHRNAIAIIDQSIRNGWQGLFEEKTDGTDKQNNRRIVGAGGSTTADDLRRTFIKRFGHEPPKQ